jgi:hypothetical protein
MIDIIYIISPLFIWMNIYYILNISKLDIRFVNRDLDKSHYFWYITRVLYWIWLLIGLFTDISNIFLINISLIVLKFVLYHLNIKLYKIWSLLLPIVNIIIIFYINYTWLT